MVPIIATGDFLLDLIQTDPKSKAEEDEVWKQQYSPLGSALPGSSGSGSSWETVSESRLMAIKDHLTDMIQERRGSRSRSRNPVRATTKDGCGCPCLDEIITKDVSRELNQL